MWSRVSDLNIWSQSLIRLVIGIKAIVFASVPCTSDVLILHYNCSIYISLVVFLVPQEDVNRDHLFNVSSDPANTQSADQRARLLNATDRESKNTKLLDDARRQLVWFLCERKQLSESPDCFCLISSSVEGRGCQSFPIVLSIPI